MATLIDYQLSDYVRAFSTTRLAPWQLTPAETEALGTYAAFNITHYCGDNPEHVSRCREWLCHELGIEKQNLWLPRQTHTARVTCVDNHLLSLSPQEQVQAIDQCDALITNLPQHCIGVSTADCVPILLYDTQNHAIAAIHAGWRGTVQHIVCHTLKTMQQLYGTNTAHIKAVLGPSISANAFEVGNKVVDAFAEAGFPNSIVSHPTKGSATQNNQKAHIDLWAANAWLLEEAGVQLHHILISGLCSFSKADTFFSARRLGIHSGRTFTGIMLREEREVTPSLNN